MKKFEIKSATPTSRTFAVPGAKPKPAKVDPIDAAIAEVENATDDLEYEGPDGRAMFADYEQRMRDVIDTEFTLVPIAPVTGDGTIVEISLHPTIVFQSRALKEQFLAEMSKRFPGEILGDKYISGDLLARALGFELTAHRPALKGEWPVPDRVKALVRA